MNVGIVCEYNPFHNGHLYQIKKIREHFGEDTNIICVMSGNYVQRGSVANFIVRGDRDEMKERLSVLNPLVLDILPLTLEEVFVYEMEALGYAFKDILM